MIDQTPFEHSENPELPLTPTDATELRFQALQLIYGASVGAYYDGLTVVDKTLQSIVIRNGGKCDRNAYIFLDDLDTQGTLIRTIYTETDAGGMQHRDDAITLLKSSGSGSKRMYHQSTLTEKLGKRIELPIHDPHALAGLISAEGEPLSRVQYSGLVNGMDLISYLSVTQKRKETAGTRIARMLGLNTKPNA